MALKVLHTSDLHIGKKFAGYDDGVREALIEARFACLSRLVQEANRQKCDLFVIAGDLFERPDVPKKDVLRVAQALAEFEGQLVALLPGNHDHLSPDGSGPWQLLREKGGDNLLILGKREPVNLVAHGLPAVLYPCPCTAKHSRENAIGWVRDAVPAPAVPHHIGVGHGSLEGVSPDFNGDYYPMTRAELEACPVQLWLLGHTHLRYPEQPGPADQIFYAGTPEPDGFDCDHAGSAWIHELGDDGSCRAVPLTTGEYQYRHDDVHVRSERDLEALKERYAAETNRKLLLKLKLTGRVPAEVIARLPEVQQEIEKLVFSLKLDEAGMTCQITAQDIDATFTTGSFPHRLLRKLAEREEDFEALQEAHRLIMEVKS
ncbi:MAG: DNA repair exonuclease [Lentisphaerae bacterium]|nr:DNA repair exonuclease [Lentisphaerota bacterium]